MKEYRNRRFLFCTSTKDKLFNFALDRIQSIEREPNIPYRDNADFDPDTFFDDIVGVTRFGNPIRIKFWASRDQASYIATKPIHPSQRIVGRPAEDGSMYFTLFVEPNWEFFSTMMGFGPGVRIISPKSVVKEIRRKLSKAVEQYIAAEKQVEEE